MDDEFISRVPPKSTGKEHYHLGFIEAHIERSNIAAVDVQATLLAFTARSIAFAIEKWASPRAPVVVCGGGRLNAALIERLRNSVQGEVGTIEERGYDGDAIEAAAFAWLAARTLAGETGSAAAVTGARGARVLGRSTRSERSDRKRVSAAAGGRRVGIRHDEPRPLQVLEVVDLRTGEVLVAH